MDYLLTILLTILVCLSSGLLGHSIFQLRNIRKIRKANDKTGLLLEENRKLVEENTRERDESRSKIIEKNFEYTQGRLDVLSELIY